MLMSFAEAGITLRAAPDRRRHPRLEHRQPVELDGHSADARDISARGLSVVVPHSVSVGEVVRVNHASSKSRGERIVSRARVVWRDVTAEGFLVGLEFVA